MLKNVAQCLPILPPGITISQFNPEHDTSIAPEIRQFCLAMIKTTYNMDYSSQWHNDLDSLAHGKDSHYSPQKRGCFLIVRNHQGDIVGTAGMRCLAWRKNLAEQFAGRYPNPENVASQWRHYLAEEYRGLGIGTILVYLRELAAVRYFYHTLYLHSEIAAIGLQKHWQKLGFTRFASDAVSAHFDKSLTPHSRVNPVSTNESEAA